MIRALALLAWLAMAIVGVVPPDILSEFGGDAHHGVATDDGDIPAYPPHEDGRTRACHGKPACNPATMSAQRAVPSEAIKLFWLPENGIADTLPQGFDPPPPRVLV